MTVITHTSVRATSSSRVGVRAWSERVQGVLMIGVLAFGAWQGGAALTAPAARHRLASVLDGPSMLAGRTSAAVNYVEAHYLPGGGGRRAPPGGRAGPAGAPTGEQDR